jgi:hypothetical protein
MNREPPEKGKNCSSVGSLLVQSLTHNVTVDKGEIQTLEGASTLCRIIKRMGGRDGWWGNVGYYIWGGGGGGPK